MRVPTETLEFRVLGWASIADDSAWNWLVVLGAFKVVDREDYAVLSRWIEAIED